MKELQAIVRALTTTPRSDWVMATLVAVEGSSYRRPGARLLVGGGQRIGSISGGCLEEDVLARAARVLATGQAETVVYDTTSENDLVWGVGLGCHGVVRVLIERVASQPAWAARVAAGLAERRATSLAVVHRHDDPTRLGTQDAAEPTKIAEATDVARTSGPDVFVQVIPPPVALHIFGAGDDAQPLARLASELGWQVTIADWRPAFATAARFPTADALVLGRAEELVARTAPDAATLAVVMTHHYIHDVPVLRALLARPLVYLGLLGPRKRAERILDDLVKYGVSITAEQRARLHAPVGLDLGADAPEQVALAIIAEMQAALTQRDARPLRERTKPIHA